MEKQLKIDLDSLSPLSATSPPTLLLTWLSAQPLTPWFRFPLPTPLTQQYQPQRVILLIVGYQMSILYPKIRKHCDLIFLLMITSSINPRENSLW
jgi:hypothetical protein